MPAAAAALLCLVLTVQDGDSLRVRCDDAPPRSAQTGATVGVRIHAIDAPEHGQAHGNRARQALRQLVYRRTVQLRCVETDGYGRRVCAVWLPAQAGAPARDVGLTLVEDGLAWWYRSYSRQQSAADRQRYAAAEVRARSQRVGLWRDGANAVPPWRWRHARPRGD